MPAPTNVTSPPTGVLLSSFGIAGDIKAGSVVPALRPTDADPTKYGNVNLPAELVAGYALPLALADAPNPPKLARYALTGDWNATGTPTTVLVQGLPGGIWAKQGVLVQTGEVVEVNVGTGTYATGISIPLPDVPGSYVRVYGEDVLFFTQYDAQGNATPLMLVGSGGLQTANGQNIAVGADGGLTLTNSATGSVAVTLTAGSNGELLVNGQPIGTGGTTTTLRDIYGATAAKEAQVKGFFPNASQKSAPDQPLSGDTSTGYGSIIWDRPNGVRYELGPDKSTPNTAITLPDGSHPATATWYRISI